MCSPPNVICVLLSSFLMGWICKQNWYTSQLFFNWQVCHSCLMKKFLSVFFTQFPTLCTNLSNSFADVMLQVLWYFGFLRRCWYSNMFPISWSQTALARWQNIWSGKCHWARCCTESLTALNIVWRIYFLVTALAAYLEHSCMPVLVNWLHLFWTMSGWQDHLKSAAVWQRPLQ